MQKTFLKYLLLMGFIAIPLYRLQAQNQPAISIDPELLKKPWPAKWLAHPTAPMKEYGVFHFRKTFDLATKPENFTIHVSADNRYKLYVNGQMVSLGPARGDLDHWNFETVNIASFLKSGKNTLAAVVWNGGERGHLAQMTYRTAFILQGNGETEKVVNTDKTWKVMQNAAYQPVVFAPVDRRLFWQYYVTGPLDSLDASAYPWSWEKTDFADSQWLSPKVIGAGYPSGPENSTHWTLVPRTIPVMEDKEQRFAAVRRTEGVAVPKDFVSGKKSFTVPANTKATILLDQGVLTMGYPELLLSGGKGSGITIKYAEALLDEKQSNAQYKPIKGNRNNIEGYGMYGVYDYFAPDGVANRTFSPLWLRTFRYVQLDVQTASEPLTIHDFKSRFSAYPFTETASFSSNSPELGKIWETGWRTARLCAHETYTDCPYYEQLQYYGDTRIQSLISLYVSGDDRLMRHAINLGDWSRNSEGITMSRYPSELPQYTPLFSIAWALMVKDYWMHRRDDAFVQSFLPGIRTIFSWFERQLNQDGMVPGLPYLDFVDSQYPRDKILENSKSQSMAVHTLYYAYGLEQLAPLFAQYGCQDEARHFQQVAARLRKAAYDKCYDTSRKSFADTPDKKSFSQHANIVAVLADAIPPAEQPALLERTLTDTSLVQAALYFQFYLFRAMNKAGMGDRYLNQLQPWRNMVANELSTFSEWEVNPRSDCHAWSASPNYDLLATVCGITPASPGFKTVQVSPQLGTLKWVKAKVPHPDGEISVDLKKTGKAGITGTVVFPAGVTGKFIWKGKEIELKGGSQPINL